MGNSFALPFAALIMPSTIRTKKAMETRLNIVDKKASRHDIAIRIEVNMLVAIE